MTWELSLTGLFIGLLVGVTGMGGGSLMTPILILLFGVESTSAKVIGAALVLGGLGFLAKTFVNRGVQPSDAPFLLQQRDRVIALVLGAVGGYIVGLTSVGSGTFFALAALLWVAGFAHLVHGNVDLGAMAWLLLGSVPGILVGSRITVRLPERSLRVGLATVLLASGVRLLEAPGYDVLVPAILIVGAVVAARVEYRRLNGAAARTEPV